MSKPKKPVVHEIQRLLAHKLSFDILAPSHLTTQQGDELHRQLLASLLKHTKVGYEKVSETRYRAVLELKEAK